jgi:abequosyltransferase
LAVRLSICIPVYNFATYLGQTLESVARQATDEVEIVVLDGGSTDATPDVVRAAQERFGRLRYVRRERRGGIDHDMALAVAAASGEYCWLLAGDDVATDGAVADLLEQTREGHDVYVCESILCGIDLAPIGKHRLAAFEGDRVLELRDPSDRRAWFSAARNTAAFFSFCSSLVVRRARWASVVHDDAFVGSCWDHVARLFRMIPDGLRVKYLATPHLLKRGENDSFMERGLADRYRITVEGYTRLADALFGHDSEEARQIRRAVRAEHNLKALLDARLMASRRGDRADVALLDRLVETLYVDGGLGVRVGRAVYRHAPVALLALAKPAYQALLAARRALSRVTPAGRGGGATPTS